MGIGPVLALTAALAYGASDFVGGTGSRAHSAWAVVLIGQVCGAALMVACGLLAPADPRAVDFASPGGLSPDERHTYSAPSRLRRNQWALQGDWRIGPVP